MCKASGLGSNSKKMFLLQTADVVQVHAVGNCKGVAYGGGTGSDGKGHGGGNAIRHHLAPFEATAAGVEPLLRKLVLG